MPRYNPHKLSTRGLCAPTPAPEVLKNREVSFINDGIATERTRTRFKDVLPVYRAAVDPHCQGYFHKPRVQRLMEITCSKQLVSEIIFILKEYLNQKQ